MKKTGRIQKIVITVIMFCILLLFLIPLYWTLMMSLDADVMTEIPTPPRMWPKTLSLDNYQYAFENVPLLRYIGNTGFLAISCTVISVFTALMCGYAFAKGQFYGKKILFVLVLAVMVVPFESIMIPLYLQYTKWGLIGTYLPIILGYFKYPYGIFLSKQNIQQIPDSLREAAYIDGASEWRTFLTVIIPLTGPTIATMCILQLIASWNSYLWPMIVLRKPSMYTLSIGVQLFNTSENVQLLGPRMAVAFISAIPVVVLFLMLQKYIVGSIATSGMKS